MFNYKEGPKSDLMFRGTPIAANAIGKGQVEYQGGNARISVKVGDLPEPTTLGPYTTYVLWALTPDGRAVNQGVIGDYEGGKGEIDTQYGASQFALIITAEPHFAVTVPSSMITLYNVAEDVKGDETKVTTLVERSDYSKIARDPDRQEDAARGGAGALRGSDRSGCRRREIRAGRLRHRKPKARRRPDRAHR